MSNKCECCSNETKRLHRSEYANLWLCEACFVRLTNEELIKLDIPIKPIETMQ